MASLKEIKGRIASVNSTKKITSAMKMVASAKLHHAQAAIENMLPYQRKLNSILSNLLASGDDFDSPYTDKREKINRVAFVVFSSDTGLCGAFNANVVKEAETLMHIYRKEQVLLYPVGKKAREALLRAGYKAEGNFDHMADKPDYAEAAQLASSLMEMFENKEIDKVELVYHHFKNTAVQVLTNETFLPLQIESNESVDKNGFINDDYILEPPAQELLALLLPKVLRLKFYTVLLDSNASEHGARTMAMQLASDNANELLQDLTVLYNKSRQQSITSELLDIMGGAAQR